VHIVSQMQKYAQNQTRRCPKAYHQFFEAASDRFRLAWIDRGLPYSCCRIPHHVTLATCLPRGLFASSSSITLLPRLAGHFRAGPFLHTGSFSTELFSRPRVALFGNLLFTLHSKRRDRDAKVYSLSIYGSSP
jgi:hypothetical protein